MTDVAFARRPERVHRGVARSVLLWDIAPGTTIKPGDPTRRFDHESGDQGHRDIRPTGPMVTSTFTTGDVRSGTCRAAGPSGGSKGRSTPSAPSPSRPTAAQILLDSSDPTRRLMTRHTGRVIEQLPDVGYHRTGMEYQFTLGNRPGRTLRVWDAATGREVLRSRHTGEITGVGLAPGGRKVALVDDATRGRRACRDRHPAGPDARARRGLSRRGVLAHGLHVVTQGPTAKLWEATTGRFEREFVAEGIELGARRSRPTGEVAPDRWPAPRLWDVSGARPPVRARAR